MRFTKFPLWFAAVVAAGLIPSHLGATENGLPVAHTGAYGEPSCSECHRPEPLNVNGQVAARIEVGPYVPGATQEVDVIVESPFATRWGFQLAARRAADPTLPAGTFEAINLFAQVRCADGTSAPCDGDQMEYATHTSAVPVGRGGEFTFAVNWTPPGEDVGEVVFTAAALAADGDLGTNNDATALATARALYAPSNSPELGEGGIVSAASPAAGMAGIAPNSLVSIFGSKLAAPDSAVNVASRDLDSNGFLPSQLNRISVEFTPAGAANPMLGRIIYVDQNQINVQAPVLAPGQVAVQAVFNRGEGDSEVRSNMISAVVVAQAPALFTLDSSGAGEVAAVSAGGEVISSRGQIARSRPALPGETVLVYGTGFGDTERDLETGELNDGPNSLTDTIGVTLDGMPLLSSEIAYAGAAPNFAGLTQFNITIPEGTAFGDHEIVITSSGPGGESRTQSGVTIAVGAPAN